MGPATAAAATGRCSTLQGDFDIFISDIQGHGDTDHGGKFVGWNRSAELALEAWNAHRHRFGPVEQFAVGHSFGGVVTGLMLALAPTWFHRAVLLDPVLFPPAMMKAIEVANALGLYRHNILARRTRQRRAAWPDRAAAYAFLHGRGGFRGWRCIAGLCGLRPDRQCLCRRAQVFTRGKRISSAPIPGGCGGRLPRCGLRQRWSMAMRHSRSR
ncbi:alpha/beta fold hydrolase [Variovorax sp. LjRoot178]|uniref:alpha/beta fold hydrolase n=1 Tax=Variovorax sp. LjRoot178 TaxID=3342277 RepID=UPI003F519A61